MKNTRILKRIFSRKDGKTIGRRKGKTRIRQDSQNESKKLVEMEMLNIPMNVVNLIEYVGNIVFWIVVILFAVWVISKFVMNISKLRSEG